MLSLKHEKYIQHNVKPMALWVLMACLIVASTGCSIQPHMELRTGDDPDNVDKDVRFQSTYYFRVFEQCTPIQPAVLDNGDAYDPLFNPAPSSGTKPFVLNDSLYRFRMTGKAHPLFTTVKFESGTLKSWEIDPFGATIKADDDGNPQFISQKENLAFAKKQREFKQAKQQIEKLLQLRAQLEVESFTGPGQEALLNQLDAQMLSALTQLNSGKAPAVDASIAAAFDVGHVNSLKLIERVNTNRGDIISQVTKLCGKMIGASGGINYSVTCNTDFNSVLSGITAINHNNGPQYRTASIDDRVKVEQLWYANMSADLERQKPEHDKLLKKIDALKDLDGQLNLSNDNKLTLDNIDKSIIEAKNLIEKIKAALTARASLTTQCVADSQKYLLAKRQLESEEFGQTNTPNTTSQCLSSSSSTVALLANHKPDQSKVVKANLAYIDAEQTLNEARQDLEVNKVELTTLLETPSHRQVFGCRTLRADNTCAAYNLPTFASLSSQPLASNLNTITALITPLNNQRDAAHVTYQASNKIAENRLAIIKTINTLVEKTQAEAKTLKNMALSVAQFSIIEPKKLAATPGQPKVCPEDMVARRGFQVMGPEGFRTFNQEERLVMAMTSSDQPLIDVMREVSQLALNQQASESDQLLPLAEERIRVLQTQRKVESSEFKLESLEETITEAINTFSGEEN